jgi:hypothetical protein
VRHLSVHDNLQNRDRSSVSGAETVRATTLRHSAWVAGFAVVLALPAPSRRHHWPYAARNFTTLPLFGERNSLRACG